MLFRLCEKKQTFLNETKGKWTEENKKKNENENENEKSNFELPKKLYLNINKRQFRMYQLHHLSFRQTNYIHFELDSIGNTLMMYSETFKLNALTLSFL